MYRMITNRPRRRRETTKKGHLDPVTSVPEGEPAQEIAHVLGGGGGVLCQRDRAPARGRKQRKVSEAGGACRLTPPLGRPTPGIGMVQKHSRK